MNRVKPEAGSKLTVEQVETLVKRANEVGSSFDVIIYEKENVKK